MVRGGRVKSMSKGRIAIGIGGAGGFGLEFVLERVWTNPEPWALWAIGIVSALLILFAIWPVLRQIVAAIVNGEPQGTQQITTGRGHAANLSQTTAGGNVTVNVGNHIHVNSAKIDPIEERDLGEEQRLTQQPIQTEAVDYEDWKHWPEVDLPTAAAIWSGSWDVGNAYRHVCFRNLKWAINAEYLSAAQLNGRKANIKSTVRPSDLKRYS